MLLPAAVRLRRSTPNVAANLIQQNELLTASNCKNKQPYIDASHEGSPRSGALPSYGTQQWARICCSTCRNGDDDPTLFMQHPKLCICHAGGKAPFPKTFVLQERTAETMRRSMFFFLKVSTNLKIHRARRETNPKICTGPT